MGRTWRIATKNDSGPRRAEWRLVPPRRLNLARVAEDGMGCFGASLESFWPIPSRPLCCTRFECGKRVTIKISFRPYASE